MKEVVQQIVQDVTTNPKTGLAIGGTTFSVGAFLADIAPYTAVFAQVAGAILSIVVAYTSWNLYRQKSAINAEILKKHRGEK